MQLSREDMSWLLLQPQTWQRIPMRSTQLRAGDRRRLAQIERLRVAGFLTVERISDPPNHFALHTMITPAGARAVAAAREAVP